MYYLNWIAFDPSFTELNWAHRKADSDSQADFRFCVAYDSNVDVFDLFEYDAETPIALQVHGRESRVVHVQRTYHVEIPAENAVMID